MRRLVTPVLEGARFALRVEIAFRSARFLVTRLGLALKTALSAIQIVRLLGAKTTLMTATSVETLAAKYAPLMTQKTALSTSVWTASTKTPALGTVLTAIHLAKPAKAQDQPTA